MPLRELQANQIEKSEDNVFKSNQTTIEDLRNTFRGLGITNISCFEGQRNASNINFTFLVVINKVTRCAWFVWSVN